MKSVGMKCLSLIGGAVVALSAAGVWAQDAGVGAAATWGAFARDSQRIYLIDMANMVSDGDTVRATIARVKRNADAGDYSHIVDVFEIQCEGRQSRMMSSTDIEADGESGDTYEEAEPWSAIRTGAFDAQIHDMTCGDVVPAGELYPSIKAFIDAGRP
jgi:hypothetical protein